MAPNKSSSLFRKKLVRVVMHTGNPRLVPEENISLVSGFRRRRMVLSRRGGAITPKEIQLGACEILMAIASNDHLLPTYSFHPNDELYRPILCGRRSDHHLCDQLLIASCSQLNLSKGAR